MIEPILSSVDKNVGKIYFNRPDKLNAFNKEMALKFQSALDAFEVDKSVRCIWIGGKGKGFSAGQDLAEVVAEDGPEMRSIVSEHYNPIIKRLRNIEKPIVAFVNGVAAGAGANIALACDIVLAAKSSSFIQAFSKIGLIPDSGGTYTLPKLIGFQKATALMFLGDKVSAVEAERLGMIYKVLEDDNGENESISLAEKLAKMPTLAFAYTKRALNASLNNNLQEQLQLEEELQFKAGQTLDFEEGVQAFLQKRQPNYKGQ